MRKLELPAINVRHPYGTLIIQGLKTVETRTYEVPPSYLDVDLLLVETGRPKNAEASVVLGIIRFTSCVAYIDVAQFRNAERDHLVGEGDKWDWSGKGKWAWRVSVVEAFRNPVKPTGPRGIRFTKRLAVTL